MFDTKRRSSRPPPNGVYWNTNGNSKKVPQLAGIPTDIENTIRKYIAQIKLLKRVSGAYIYGSYAKDRASMWSDIDVAIISPDFSHDLFEERVALMKLALRFDDRIEPRPFRPEDFYPDNPLVHEIRTSGIEISAS
mgnify:CR=1 FL=1